MRFGGIVTLCIGVILVSTVISAAPGCGDDGGSSPEVDAEPQGPPRLVPPEDPDYRDLEIPEFEGECGREGDCDISCENTCIVDRDGPTTCPVEPDPLPERVANATCTCRLDVCAWFDPSVL